MARVISTSTRTYECTTTGARSGRSARKGSHPKASGRSRSLHSRRHDYNDTASLEALKEENIFQTGLSLFGLLEKGKEDKAVRNGSKKRSKSVPPFMGMRHTIIDDDSDALRLHDLENEQQKRFFKGDNGKKPVYATDRNDMDFLELRAGYRGSTGQNANESQLFVPSDAPTVILPPLPPPVPHNFHRKTRRRLQWRVGPLVKKPKAKNRRREAPPHRRNSLSLLSSGSSTADEASLAEKTVRSFHTIHSTETVKVVNNNSYGHPIGKFLGGGGKARYPAEVSSPTSTASTVSSSHADDYGGDETDSESIVEALDVDEQEDHEPQRTIGLFLFDRESHLKNSALDDKHKSMLPIKASSEKHILSKKKSSNRSMRIGRPPLGATNSRSASAKAIVKSASSPNVHTHDQNDDDSSAPGGVLWQLAKLQAISEGLMRGEDASSNGNESATSSQGGSSQKSVASSVDGSVQKIQAERNLRAIHRLAAQHLYFGEYDEAIEVLEEMLRGVQEMYGRQHYRVGTVLHNLATAFMRARRYNLVIQTSKSAIDIRRNTLGTLHPDLAVSYSQMGLAHMELEQNELAVRAFQKALEIRRKTLPARDKKISRLLNNIGCALFDLGYLKEATYAFDEALEIQRWNMKSTRGGANLMREGVEGGQGVVSQSLLTIASTLCNLGSIKLRWKQYDEALVHLEEALLIQQSVYGDVHPTVKNTKDSIEFIAQQKQGHETNDVNPASSARTAIENLTRNMEKVGLDEKRLRSIRLPNPFGAFSDVMSLNKNEWMSIFEEIGGSPKLCMNCSSRTADIDEISLSDLYSCEEGEEPLDYDLHWI